MLKKSVPICLVAAVSAQDADRELNSENFEAYEPDLALGLLG